MGRKLATGSLWPRPFPPTRPKIRLRWAISLVTPLSMGVNKQLAQSRRHGG